MSKLAYIFLFVLVCRIWTFDVDSGGTSQSITEWLKDKKIVSVNQSSSFNTGYGRTQNIITIIAETIDNPKGAV